MTENYLSFLIILFPYNSNKRRPQTESCVFSTLAAGGDLLYQVSIPIDSIPNTNRKHYLWRSMYNNYNNIIIIGMSHM